MHLLIIIIFYYNMCFNPTASLIAFSIGFISWIILLFLQINNASVIVIYLSLIQLVEYFAHISLINKDKSLNVITSKSIFFITLFQPLIYYIASLLTKTEYSFKYANDYLFLIPIYIILIIFFYIYLNNNKLFKITYLNNSCQNVCRLSWDFFGYNTLFTIFVFILYFAICIIFWKKMTLDFYARILIIISIIYTLFLSRKLKSIFSIFGSIWCFLAVTYGPFVIIRYLM